MRKLTDVEVEEVIEAVKEMCAKLNMAGSVAGVYDLYETISKAHQQALRVIISNEILKNCNE
jgi:hypothetical protein